MSSEKYNQPPPEVRSTKSVWPLRTRFQACAFWMVFWVVILPGLTACVSAPALRTAPVDAAQWQQQQQRLLAHSAWEMRGKVAIKNGDDGGQVDVFWRQQDLLNYEVKLLAPFGAGGGVLVVTDEQAALHFSNGEQAFAANLETLLQQVNDWPFPVSGMRYWLRGLMAPPLAAQHPVWNEQSYLQQFEQDGWRIELQNYAIEGDVMLPRKIFMQRISPPALSLKLVVRQWSLP